jgi:glycerophosphoryl diester phosphodiesterase
MPFGADAVVAHRGLARLFPENTRAAVLGALRAGIPRVEIDVQLTRDGVPVLWHDAGTERMTGVKADVRELTWNTLGRFSAHEPGRFGRRFRAERPCRLDALAQTLAGEGGLKTLFVELKAESLRRFGRTAMLALCAEALAPIRRRVVLISFDLPVLALARRLTRFALGPVLTRWSQGRSAALRALRPDWIFVDQALLPARGSLQPHFGRARLCAYEVPDPLRARELLDRGLAAVETFRADTLVQELGLYL